MSLRFGFLWNKFLISFTTKLLRKQLQETNYSFYESFYFMKEKEVENYMIKNKRMKEAIKDGQKEAVKKLAPKPKKELFDIEIYEEEEDKK